MINFSFLLICSEQVACLWLKVELYFMYEAPIVKYLSSFIWLIRLQIDATANAQRFGSL